MYKNADHFYTARLSLASETIALLKRVKKGFKLVNAFDNRLISTNHGNKQSLAAGCTLMRVSVINLLLFPSNFLSDCSVNTTMATQHEIVDTCLERSIMVHH